MSQTKFLAHSIDLQSIHVIASVCDTTQHKIASEIQTYNTQSGTHS